MFKKGDRVEIVNWGSSYSRNTASKLANANRISLDSVSNWSDEVRGCGITLPVRATVIDLDNTYSGIDDTKYLLKIDHCNWHICMAEASLGMLGVCIKALERTNKIENIKVIRNDMVTIVILSDGSKGVAKCHPDDRYDEVEGLKLAYERAKGIKREQKTNNVSNMTINISATISNKDEIKECIDKLKHELENMKIGLTV